MGQLTNLYVSSSYQGLLKLTDSTTGLTGTLQPVQDGLGGDSPLQISKTQVNISGSLTVNGSPISVDTGSLVTTSSFNAYTSSVNTKLAGLDIETGSLQSEINQKLNTSSFNSYTSSNNAIVNSLVNATGSYATTSSLTALSQSIATTDLSQNNRLTSIESITGSLATTSSLTSLSQSIATTDLGQNNRLTSLETTTSSLQNQINQKLDSSSINSYTSSNDGKVNDLISKTGSYATTGSNNFVGQQNINNSVNITGSLNVTGEITALSASITYLETIYQTSSVIFSSGSNILGDEASDTQTLFGTVRLPNGPLSVTGSVTATNFTGSLEGTASYATQALSASYAPTILPNGVVSGSQQILDLGFAITSSVNTKLDTGSFNTYSGDTLNLINQKLDTGSFNSYTASIDARTGSYITTGSAAGTQSITGSLILSGSAGVELDVKGDQTNTGSVNISGSLNVNGPVTLLPGTGLPTTPGLVLGGNTSNKLWVSGSNNDVYLRSIADIILTAGNNGNLKISGPGGTTPISASIVGNVDLTGSLNIRNGNFEVISDNTTLNPDLYLTSSQVGQSNIIKGWSDNPAAGGAGAVQSNYTSSLRITGSNNMVSMPLLRATGLGGGVDLQGYISGSDNTFSTNGGGIYLNTGSLLFPKTTNNFIGANSSILLNFTTSSLAGGHPTIQNNTLYAGQIAINSNSGSITVGGNVVNAGSVTSTQNFVTNVRPSIGQNIINGAGVTLNHISSSINYNSNINNSPVTINNHLSSSITTNLLAFTNNTVLGGSNSTGLNVWVSGSQSSNTGRFIIDNLIGGKNITVSSSFVSSSTSNLVSSLIYGQGLIVSGNHAATIGGSTFVGRFNDATSLNLAQDVVFAVGTGTAAANRRTGLYVTSGSLVGVSGSLNVIGNSTFVGNSVMTGSLTVSGSFGSINGIGDVVLSGTTKMYETNGFPLQVFGTINSKRLHFSTNPFNNEPSSNLGALRFEGTNRQFYLTNYDTAQITTQSIVSTFVDTGSAYVETSLGANNRGVDTYLRLTNASGTGSLSTNVNTIVSGSLVVTGSLSVGGNLQFNVGAFSSTQNQSGSANVSQSISYNTTDYSQGVSVVSGSRLTIANKGVYNIQFSAQLLADTGADNVYIWLKKNGTNVSNSAGHVVLANNDELIATWNYVVDANAGDYYELAWQSSGGDAILLTETATGNIPSIPSIITTVTQVR